MVEAWTDLSRGGAKDEMVCHYLLDLFDILSDISLIFVQYLFDICLIFI